MDGCEIIEDAPPAAFFDNPQNERTRRLLRRILTD
jgi:ABC-type polar amino acid transport system ATPase subunit